MSFSRTSSICLFVLLFSSFGTVAAEYPSLRGAISGQMQSTLQRTLIKLGIAKSAKSGKLAVALVDISDLENPRLAAVNGDHMMYAASLPKIGILLAAMYEVERGNLRLTPGIKRSLTDMIRRSSNEDATRMMNVVGKRRVNQILSLPRFRFYDARVNGGIWVGKEYGKRPAFARDPLNDISHGATVMQVARMYYLLETGQLLRPDLNAIMKEMLSRPAIQHKFVKGLQGRDVEIFRKSGTWHQFHADSAIVESPGGSYILVALAEDARGGDWLVKLAGSLHDAMYPRRLARR